MDITGTPDGAIIVGKGGQSGKGVVFGGGEIVTHHDHRIAMSFDILNLYRNKKFANYSKNLSKISFPEFQQSLGRLLI